MFDMAAIRKNLSDKLCEKEIEVQVHGCINDMIKEVKKIGICIIHVGEKQLKYRKNGTVDKCSFNSGTGVHQGRCLAFIQLHLSTGKCLDEEEGEDFA